MVFSVATGMRDAFFLSRRPGFRHYRKSMTAWHEDDGFWEQLGPLLLDERISGDATSQVDDVAHLLELEEGAHILDLGCGIGRHSVELARRGFRVTGVDRTEKYLDTARQKAASADVRIEFIHDDMRRFRRGEAFDAAVNMLSSFGYFADPAEDRRVLDNIHTSLKPGGRLLTDLAGKEVLARIYQGRDWGQVADGTLVLEERKVVGAWEAIQTRWIFIQGTERQEFTTCLRLYSAREITDLLKKAGFGSVAVHGALDGSPYDQTATRLIVTARK